MRGDYVRRHAWMAYAAATAVAVGVYLRMPDGTEESVLYLAVSFAALGTMGWLLVRSSPRPRGPWLIFAAGFGLWVLGDTYYTVAGQWLGETAGTISPSDYLYFAGYAALAGGLMWLASHGHRENRATLLDAAIVSVGLALLVWAAFVDPLTNDSSTTVGERLMGAAYPVLDVFLLALVVRLLARTGGRGTPLHFVALGVILCLVGDVLWRGYLFSGSDAIGTPINAFYLAGYSCFAIGFLHPAREAAPSVSMPARLTRRHVLLLSLSMIVLPVVLLLSRPLEGSDVFVLTAGATLLLSLLLARLVHMVHAAQDSAEKALSANVFLETVIEASPVPMAIVGVDGLVQRWNGAASRHMGVSSDEVVGRPLPVDLPLNGNGNGHGAAGIGSRFFRRRSETEVEVLKPNGRRADLLVSVGRIDGDQGDAGATIAAWTDITTRKRQVERLRYLAAHDMMTGLPNRGALEEELTEVIRRQDGRASLIMADVDHMKAVNDSSGHGAGDRLLLHVVETLRRALRNGDVLARIGGDEFALLLQDVTPVEARQIGERILRAVSRSSFEDDGITVHPTVSAGLCPINDGLDKHAVLAAADTALQHAKNRGRNRLVFAEGTRPKALALNRANAWAIRVDNALHDARLTFFLQPVVDLASGETRWFEALARIVDPDGTVTGPAVFLAPAERFGLIPAIDRRILKLVLDALDEDRSLRIYMNLSASSFHDDEVLRLIEERHPSIAASLGLEVTEQTAMLDFERSADRLGLFKELGCNIALDDFGVGFSSFGQLSALPADVVKIPREFVGQLTKDAGARAIVTAIVTVAHALGKEVVAEGVEDAEVAAELRLLEVEYGQGFLWGVPSRRLPAPASRREALIA